MRGGEGGVVSVVGTVMCERRGGWSGEYGDV